MFRAIWKQHQTDRDQNRYLEEIAMYVAISPWAALALFGFVEKSQLVEVLCTNTGIIAITCLFIWKSIQKARVEYRLQLNGGSAEILKENIKRYSLTKMEVAIVELLLKGLSNKEIADQLHISEETVKKHVYNTFKKMSVKNRAALIYKFQNVCFNVLWALFL
jgi:DNA-binding NarL/FixJ family response regulator